MTIAIKKINGAFRASIKKLAGVGNDPFTKSLLHFNGTDASTTFTDEAGKTWTATGNAQLDTADYKFATASLLLDGIGDDITTPNSADFDMGTGNFTWDCWIKRNGVYAYAGVLSTLKSDYTGLNIDLSATGNALRVTCTVGVTPTVIIADAGTVADLTWTHIALIRNGNTITLYKAGTSVGSYNCTGMSFNSSGLGFGIGITLLDNPGTYTFGGWIDEVRVSKGVARWTGNFTPPNAEYRILGVKKFMGVSNI